MCRHRTGTLSFMLQMKWALAELVPSLANHAVAEDCVSIAPLRSAALNSSVSAAESLAASPRVASQKTTTPGYARRPSLSVASSSSSALENIMNAVLQSSVVTRQIRRERAYTFLIDDGERMDSKSWALLMRLPVGS